MSSSHCRPHSVGRRERKEDAGGAARAITGPIGGEMPAHSQTSFWASFSRHRGCVRCALVTERPPTSPSSSAGKVAVTSRQNSHQDLWAYVLCGHFPSPFAMPVGPRWGNLAVDDQLSAWHKGRYLKWLTEPHA